MRDGLAWGFGSPLHDTSTWGGGGGKLQRSSALEAFQTKDEKDASEGFGDLSLSILGDSWTKELHDRPGGEA